MIGVANSLEDGKLLIRNVISLELFVEQPYNFHIKNYGDELI